MDHSEHILALQGSLLVAVGGIEGCYLYSIEKPEEPELLTDFLTYEDNDE